MLARPLIGITAPGSGHLGAVAPDAIIYVRTDAREFTLEVTTTALEKAFPGKKRMIKARPFTKKTQTALFGDADEKPGEMDIILR